jgi:hypothetical protein
MSTGYGWRPKKLKRNPVTTLLAVWPQVAPPELAERTRAVKLLRRGEKRSLRVRVSDAATAAELSFHTPVLLEKLNSYEGQTHLRLDGIELTIGSVFKP